MLEKKVQLSHLPKVVTHKFLNDRPSYYLSLTSKIICTKIPIRKKMKLLFSELIGNILQRNIKDEGNHVFLKEQQEKVIPI